MDVFAEKILEKQRFESTFLRIVDVKRAPWSDRQMAFGTLSTLSLFSAEDPIVVICPRTGAPLETFDNIDDFLDHWIGD